MQIEASYRSICYCSLVKDRPDISSLAAIIGDPARANMLSALMSGMALTAGELAREAGVTAQTASSHLAKLADAGLVAMTIQGRHRYFRIAGPHVAGALEGLMELAVRVGRLRTRPGPRDAAMRVARVCYDHLAGAKGVALYDAMIDQGLVVAKGDGLGVSARGRARFVAEGVAVDALQAKARPFCLACLDWSERRPHLAGSLGAALLELVLARDWAKRAKNGRAILFTESGSRAFEAFLAPEIRRHAAQG